MKSIAMAAWAAVLLAGQEPAKVENGEYERWARFKVGSQVHFKITSNAEVQADDELVITLRTLDEDQAVLDRAFLGVVAGRRRTTKSERIVPAKVFKGQDSEGRAGKEVGKGEETIDVLGKKVKCRWVEVEYSKTHGEAEIKLREKTWYHASVVGGVARMEIKRMDVGITTAYEAAESKPAK
jgi:hypothetical protein